MTNNTLAANEGSSGVFISPLNDPPILLRNNIVVSEPVGISVSAGKTTTVSYTLWRGNSIDIAGSGPVDLIFFCVKSYAVPPAAEILRPLIAPQTAVFPVQNGVGHIKALSDILGTDHVLGGVSLLAGQRPAPGIVCRSRSSETLEFGELDGRDSIILPNDSPGDQAENLVRGEGRTTCFA